MHKLCTSHFNCVPLLSGTYLLVKNIKKKKEKKRNLTARTWKNFS